MESITVKQIVKAIQVVPEKKFRITDLAGQLLDEHGKVDILKAMDKQGELNTAIAEVESYVKGNKNLLGSLWTMNSKAINTERELGEDMHQEGEEWE